MPEERKIHSALKVPYSGVVGQSIMLLDAEGACIAQLAVVGATDPGGIADQVVAFIGAEPDDYDDPGGTDECPQCGGEGGFNYCGEDCCPVMGGEDACTDPRCWTRCDFCEGKG